MKVTVFIGKDAPRTPAVEALRHEHAAVRFEFKAHSLALMKMTGWDQGVATQVMECLVLAYEIGAAERWNGGRDKGERPAGPPEALAVPWHRIIALTQDKRAAALVERAFQLGWARNKPRSMGAPKKSAGATVMELMKRTGKEENDKRERWRLRKRLRKLVEEFRSS